MHDSKREGGTMCISLSLFLLFNNYNTPYFPLYNYSELFSFKFSVGLILIVEDGMVILYLVGIFWREV